MACCLGSHPRCSLRVETPPGKRFVLLTALGFPCFGACLRWGAQPRGWRPRGQPGAVEAVTPSTPQPRGGQGVAPRSMSQPAQESAFSPTSILMCSPSSLPRVPHVAAFRPVPTFTWRHPQEKSFLCSLTLPSTLRLGEIPPASLPKLSPFVK